jgi:hypothetical protein
MFLGGSQFDTVLGSLSDLLGLRLSLPQQRRTKLAPAKAGVHVTMRRTPYTVRRSDAGWVQRRRWPLLDSLPQAKNSGANPLHGTWLV